MKVLADISTPQFSNTGGLEEMPDYGSAMDDDADDDNSDDEGVNGRSEHDGKQDYLYLDAKESPYCCMQFYFINRVVG